jgi:hypothetical protein
MSCLEFHSASQVISRLGSAPDARRPSAFRKSNGGLQARICRSEKLGGAGLADLVRKSLAQMLPNQIIDRPRCTCVIDGVKVFGSPSGGRSEKGTRCDGNASEDEATRQIRGCPRNCKRRVDCAHATGRDGFRPKPSGKAAGNVRAASQETCLRKQPIYRAWGAAERSMSPSSRVV